MRKVSLKQGITKKTKIEIPAKFLANCGGRKNKKEAFIEENDNFIIIAKDHETMKSKAGAISNILDRDVEEGVVSVYLHKTNCEVPYKEVTGFFLYRGVAYYRVKGVAGKSLDDNKSFTEKIKELYPEEYGEVSAAQVSDIMVVPLVTL